MSNLAVIEKQASKPKNFNVAINNFEEAMRFSEMVSKSSLCPKSYFGKPGDCFIAMQMGAEVGLSPMQALQNIAVINGRPSIWGDAVIGLLQSRPDIIEEVHEWMEGSVKDENGIAYCSIKRKNQAKPIVRKFSIDDAKQAKLWGKEGPWRNYSERMLQMRARGFCARDGASDILKGLAIAEEAQEYSMHEAEPVVNAKPIKGVAGVKQALGIAEEEAQDVDFNEETGEVIKAEPVEQETPDADKIKKSIISASDIKQLHDAVKEVNKLDDDNKNKMRELYRKKLSELKKEAK